MRLSLPQAPHLDIRICTQNCKAAGTRINRYRLDCMWHLVEKATAETGLCVGRVSVGARGTNRIKVKRTSGERGAPSPLLQATWLRGEKIVVMYLVK